MAGNSEVEPVWGGSKEGIVPYKDNPKIVIGFFYLLNLGHFQTIFKGSFWAVREVICSLLYLLFLFFPKKKK